MSEDNNTQGAPEAAAEEAAAAKPAAEADRIGNLKSEFDRKLDNINSQFEKLTQMLEPKQAPQPTAPSKKVSVFENEDEFASTIEERATQKATEISARMIQTQKQFDAVVAQATSNYPELNDPSTSVYQKLKSKLDSQHGALKGTPEGFRMAVLEAAAEEGLVPAAKRPKSASGSDDFSISSSGSQSSRRPSREPEIDQESIEFAQLIGAPTNNKEFQKFMKNASQRKFGKYE
jgi:hypothetical protein